MSHVLASLYTEVTQRDVSGVRLLYTRHVLYIRVMSLHVFPQMSRKEDYTLFVLLLLAQPSFVSAAPWTVEYGGWHKFSKVSAIVNFHSSFRRTLISQNFYQHLLGRLCWCAPGQSWRVPHPVWDAQPVVQGHHLDPGGQL